MEFAVEIIMVDFYYCYHHEWKYIGRKFIIVNAFEK